MLFPALLFGLLSGYLAWRKGYSFWTWFLPSLVGCIVMGFLPHTQDFTQPIDLERTARRRKRGNKIGLILTAVFFVVDSVLVAVVFSASPRY
jgi:membrane protease YdiL (CAAX protease family)